MPYAQPTAASSAVTRDAQRQMELYRQRVQQQQDRQQQQQQLEQQQLEQKRLQQQLEQERQQQQQQEQQEHDILLEEIRHFHHLSLQPASGDVHAHSSSLQSAVVADMPREVMYHHSTLSCSSLATTATATTAGGGADFATPQQQAIGSGRAPGRQLFSPWGDRPYSATIGSGGMGELTSVSSSGEYRTRSGAASAPMFSDGSPSLVSPTFFADVHLSRQSFQPLNSTAEVGE